MMLHTTIQNQASVYLFPVAGDGEVEQKHRECQQLGDGEGEPDAVGAGDAGHEEEGGHEEYHSAQQGESTGIKATIVTNTKAWVTLIRATFSLPRESWMEATTEQPAPIIRPTPVSSISTGTQKLTAAIPSLPTPCPTKIPSMAVTADMLTMAKSVGKKYLLKRENTLALLKSIASLFIFCSLMVALYIPQTQNAGQGDWFYPVILSGILPCPPMRITKLRAKVGQKSGIANFSVNLRI